MAELPEISKLSRQMKSVLCGKKITDIDILQEKCANISPADFRARTRNAVIKDVENKGKWIITSLDNGEYILLSLGMGADVYFYEAKREEEKYQIEVLFSDKSGYTARFWWFGKFFLVSEEELKEESNTKDIAIHPFEEAFSYPYFQSLLKGKKTRVKAFILNQHNIGGIGNMYAHDILFTARLHPQKKISDMKEKEIKALYEAILGVLRSAEEKGSFFYEKDFFGQNGGFTENDFLVGYKKDKPCPICATPIVSIKTGSTSSFICPHCQTL